ncbi:hypothetical protein AB0O01_34010 [Streptomyces sp. NPDC093252]|uniref:hypothetical protein n=1 Tax=Streptomyces sp. NPDC093252 TaxID=3154980 RepID=UPI003437A84D
MKVTQTPHAPDAGLPAPPPPHPARQAAAPRVQPVPAAVAGTATRGAGGLARDRMRLWSQYGARYRAAMAEAAAVLAGAGRDGEGPAGLDERVGARADLAALRLYLAEEWAWAEPALLDGGLGAHLPLTRCAAAGVRRLPAHRGAAIVRTDVPESTAGWFMDRAVVVDHGLWSASVSTAALGAGGPGYAVWSLTGRVMGDIDPYTPDRLVFRPGTRFKVLDVRAGRQPLVLLREMSPHEPEQPGSGGDTRGEWLDTTTVAELRTALEQSSALTPTAFQGPRARPPGLIEGLSQ